MPTAPATPDVESASKMNTYGKQATPAAAPPEMKIDNFSVRPAENGGFIASVSRSPVAPPSNGAPGPYVPSKDYAFTGFAELTAFMAQEFGVEAEAPEPEPESPMAAATPAEALEAEA